MSMPVLTRPVPVITDDVLQNIFDYLEDDHTSLSRASRTCHQWYAIVLPYLLGHVDLSSHNNGRLPDREDDLMLCEVYADYDNSFRQEDLVPRQRAFIRTMIDRPDLAPYVRSLTWTLIWKDFYEDDLMDIDYQTWSVFSLLTSVQRLDLASLHDIEDIQFIRQNPAKLFPAVTDLRLLGHMHRGLVKAILSAIDTSLLRSLAMDYLLDEGAISETLRMSEDTALRFAPSGYGHEISLHIDDELHRRQEDGTACIFPGPMWLPLRILSSSCLRSMTSLQLKISGIDSGIDIRIGNTLVREAATLIFQVRKTLKSLTFVIGEGAFLFYTEKLSYTQYHRWNNFRSTYRPWYIRKLAAMLNRLLKALEEGEYPQLTHLEIRGFRHLQNEQSVRAAIDNVEDVWSTMRGHRFEHMTFTEYAALDYRPRWAGFENDRVDRDKFAGILRNS